MTQVFIELFTDPACPFAFSAEPIRQRLRWHYGDGLRRTLRMIALTREDGEADCEARDCCARSAGPWASVVPATPGARP